ncbi:MAG: DUF190 domain-containing protein [Sphingobacteriales bacterium]|nr:DUF190 domain-containing protein [Sphingobacteriales bacterium]
MNRNVEIKETALGKIKIYLTAREKIKTDSILGKIRGRQTYREILQKAKDQNLMSASVYHTHGGFSINQEVSFSNSETDSSKSIICVELIDKKEKLENFCIQNQHLLKDKVIIFKAVEFWSVV